VKYRNLRDFDGQWEDFIAIDAEAKGKKYPDAIHRGKNIMVRLDAFLARKLLSLLQRNERFNVYEIVEPPRVITESARLQGWVL